MVNLLSVKFWLVIHYKLLLYALLLILNMKSSQLIISCTDLEVWTYHQWGSIMAIFTGFYIVTGMLDFIPIDVARFLSLETLKEAYTSVFNIFLHFLKY